MVQHEPLRFAGQGLPRRQRHVSFFFVEQICFVEQILFGGRRKRSGVHGDARNDDQEAIFDTPVLDGGVRYESSVFCAVWFKPQGSV